MSISTSFIEFVSSSSAILGLSAALGTLIFSSGALRKSRAEKIDEILNLSGGEVTNSLDKESSAIPSTSFETTALSKYYNQALQRANVSFWFSLIFASIGFIVIISAFFSHSPADPIGTVIKVTSGAIIDAVSALFYVQSKNAQDSMTHFFEKLRLDRLNIEARRLLNEIENVERRDQMRAQLVIKYSDITQLIVGRSE